MTNEPVNQRETLPTEQGGTSRELSVEEREIQNLEAQLAKRRSELRTKKLQESAPQQEAVLDAIIENTTPSTSPTTDAASTDDNLSGEEKFRINQLKQMDKENQIKFLINISFQKGLDEGIRLAKALNNPYIVDEFHDQLADQFYSKLVEAHKLEEL